jgi:hypothetical protein
VSTKAEGKLRRGMDVHKHDMCIPLSVLDLDPFVQSFGYMAYSITQSVCFCKVNVDNCPAC